MKSRLYTLTGDNGTTSLVGGTRVAKDSLRIEAYGTLDELNSWLGLIAASTVISDELRAEILTIQRHLFDIGTHLATEPSSRWQPDPFPAQAVRDLERSIDALDASLPPLRRFILPGGHPDAARAHIARTVARRAERRIISLNSQPPAHADAPESTAIVAPEIIAYINRLSDWLFALARHINLATNTPESLL